LPWPAAFAGPLRLGVLDEAGGDELSVTRSVAGERFRVERCRAGSVGGLDGVFDLDQQAGQLVCPGLAALLLDGGQLAEVVCVAEGVGAVGVGAVGREAVVDGDAAEAWEDAEGVDPFLAAPGVEALERQRPGCGLVDPVQLAGRAGAGLVEVHDR
jgi:hypothetical protein